MGVLMLDPNDLPDLDDAPVVEPDPEPKSHTDEDESAHFPDPEEPAPDGREEY